MTPNIALTETKASELGLAELIEHEAKTVSGGYDKAVAGSPVLIEGLIGVDIKALIDIDIKALIDIDI